MVFACREGVLLSRTKAINELKSLIVVAPEELRAQLRGRSLAVQLTLVDQLRAPATAPVEQRLSIFSLQSIAARVRFLSTQLAELDPQLLDLIKQHPAGPALLAETGVGPVVAAQLLISWSHHGRVRSEAAFASLAGVAPIEASSGQRSRHRLNRGGDRPLNRALHTARDHPDAVAVPPRDPRLRAAPQRRGQDPPRHPTLRQTRACPTPLPPNRDSGPAKRSLPTPLDRHRSVEWAAAPVLLEEDRPVRPHRGRARRGGRRAQRSTSSSAELAHSNGGLSRRTVALIA